MNIKQNMSAKGGSQARGRQSASGGKIIVEVKPNSKEIKIEKITNNVYKIKLTASPIGGRANQQLIEVLAKHLGVTKSQLEIKSGKTSKTKVLVIYG